MHFALKYLVVPKTPVYEQGKIHIACLGDSITFGAGVNGKKEETWEYFLNELLGTDHQVLNYGISGRTLQREGDYPYTADKFYGISKENRIETYLIMLGTNDAKPYNFNEDRYKKELHAFVKEYKELPWHPQVILMSVPQVFEDRNSGVVGFDIDKDNIASVQQLIKEEAKKEKIPCIDLYAYTKDKEDWFVDGVHPNKKGNEEIAAYIFRQLEILRSVL
jgi:lysophospholipase L1-like esterase